MIAASTPIPARVARAEEFLKGRPLTHEIAAEAGDIVASDINALSDLRGDEPLRREMVRVVTRRTLAALFELPSTDH